MISPMNQRMINRLLKELTPEIRSYLFPGLPEPVERPDYFENILEGWMPEEHDSVLCSLR